MNKFILGNGFPMDSLTLKDGSIITLILEDDDVITFYKDESEQSCGGEFRFEEHDTIPDKYLITSMSSPYKRQGLGQLALKLFIEERNATLYVRPFNGPQMNDGSHISPDAEAFVQKMIDRGLIESNCVD